jgi:hypothetical protein
MRRWVVGGALVAAVLAASVPGFLPETEDGYLETLVSSARDARSAVLTAAEVGQAQARGAVFPAYTEASVQDARDEVSAAITDVVDAEVPGQASRAKRDELLPLLMRSAALVDDVADEQLRDTAVGGLRDVAEQLAAFQGRAS